MDRMYRFQRYFYDFTRKYYLLGRDRLIDEMEIKAGERILEIGCGTGRNLSILASKYPGSEFYGLDASAAMLETASSNLRRKGLTAVKLENSLADDFGFDTTFGLKRPFEAVFFSYSISMIPTWRKAIDNSLRNLMAGGSIYVVDFYDQSRLPDFFARLLKAWLRLFHVVYPAELLPYFEQLEREGFGKLSARPLFRGYSLILKFEKTAG